MAAASNRMGPRLVALCAAAVGIVYTAGYVITIPAAAAEAGAVPPQAAIAAAPRPAPPQEGQRGRHGRGGRDGAPPAPSFSAPPSPQPAPVAPAGAGKYRDGTFTGRGTNRIGSVDVAVTIKNHKIADVTITNATTHYPQSYIDHLPQQVLQRQSAQVDAVSGATKSVADFATAVQQALAQAQL